MFSSNNTDHSIANCETTLAKYKEQTYLKLQEITSNVEKTVARLQPIAFEDRPVVAEFINFARKLKANVKLRLTQITTHNANVERLNAKYAPGETIPANWSLQEVDDLKKAERACHESYDLLQASENNINTEINQLTVQIEKLRQQMDKVNAAIAEIETAKEQLKKILTAKLADNNWQDIETLLNTAQANLKPAYLFFDTDEIVKVKQIKKSAQDYQQLVEAELKTLDNTSAQSLESFKTQLVAQHDKLKNYVASTIRYRTLVKFPAYKRPNRKIEVQLQAADEQMQEQRQEIAISAQERQVLEGKKNRLDALLMKQIKRLNAELRARKVNRNMEKTANKIQALCVAKDNLSAVAKLSDLENLLSNMLNNSVITCNRSNTHFLSGVFGTLFQGKSTVQIV